MRFSLEWIRTLVPDAPSDPADVARALTDAGLAVENTEPIEHDGEVVDHALEIEVTTNRPDAMSHLGIARELAAIFGVPVVPSAPDPEPVAERAADAASLAVDEPDLCPSYVALVLRDVTVGPSPDWLQRRLRAIGARPVNNVVDATNFVLWETGQPLHAFDLERIGGATVRVRRARDGEIHRTLDGEKRVLDPEILVIADAEDVIGLAGIMGGEDSEVTDSTRHVLLESAHFDPAVVRRGARKLGMHTDASHRFERGTDPTGCHRAALRTAELILATGGGRLLAGHLEETRLPERFPPRIRLDHDKLERFAGIGIPAGDVERILVDLGFELEARNGGESWDVTAPPWRWYDFENPYPADLYEEVLRIHGFMKVPATLPAIPGADPGTGPAVGRRRRLRDQLAASGLAEAIHLAFHDRAAAERYPSLLGDREPVVLANPVSERYAVMRRSLVPGLVESALYNQRRGREAVRLFEIGHVFADGGPDRPEEEIETVGVVLGGLLGTPWQGRRELDLYDLKGVLEPLAERFRVRLGFEAAPIDATVPGTSGHILAGGRSVGWLGRIDDDDLVAPLWAAELRADAFESSGPPRIELPSRFPGIAVDLTLTHSLEVPWAALDGSIAALRAPELVSWRLEGRYRGDGVPDGAVNTTVSFLYGSDERSLTQEEVNSRHLALAGELARRHGLATEEAR